MRIVNVEKIFLNDSELFIIQNCEEFLQDIRDNTKDKKTKEEISKILISLENLYDKIEDERNLKNYLI